MENPEGKFAVPAYPVWVAERGRPAIRPGTKVARRYASERVGQNAGASISGTGASCEFISTPGRVDGTSNFVKRIATEIRRKLLMFCKGSDAVR